MNKVLLTFVLLSSSLVQGLMAHDHTAVIEGAPMYVDTTRVDTGVTLRGVTVVGNSIKDVQMQSSINRIMIDQDYLTTNFAGSLMQSLHGVPGVKAMNIGSGQSKPTIRGLGFNRMVVAEDGIKHEGQQWGFDHGLEIDQFAIDRIEIIKGPSALLYGSDAIGGVINLYSNYIPTKPFEGSVSLFTRTNNESLGLSSRFEGRRKKFYWRTNLTAIDYADYKVTTDTIAYYSYRIGLHDKRLRNTAGKELDGSLTLGYTGYRLHTAFQVSDSYAKSGFFANAHGLEVRNSKLDYDSSSRDIDLPYQSVNHLKVMSRSVYQAGALVFKGTLAYQNNVRKEFSEPVSHGYMPKPSGSLERQFNKNTYTAQFEMSAPIAQKHDFKTGMNAEYQHNRRRGWGFVIPDFETFSFGAYAYDRFNISKDLAVNAGMRYDYAHTNIHSYSDWYQTPVNETDSVYKMRSDDISRTFNSFTWSAGINYASGNWMLKANIGKSFRMPIPKELGADGVSYHIFRYEKGNAELEPEESYQLDAGIHWSNGKVSIQAAPYLNYFPNYIYMNPTAHFYEGLQLYNYSQSRVLRYGFEAMVNWKILPSLEGEAKGEYLHAEQKSGEKKGYTLPFSTPWSIDGGLKYLFDRRHGKEGFVGFNVHIVGAQNDIVPPEEPTPGYYTLSMTAGKTISLKHCNLNVSLNADNLLNRKYYDHTSYYRLIYIPEPGRNVSLMVTAHF
ncbi:MAG: TonB-dependent receptor [Prevotella sp.]|jgi:iron complex outermembrane receptor protein